MRGSPLTSISDDRDPQVRRLERMRNDFLVAQKRRRERVSGAATRDDETADGTRLAGAATDDLAGIAPVRP